MSATAQPRPARRTPAEPESHRRTSWWDPFALILLGLAGGALSYDALRQMAVAVHIRPHLAYLFPLVVDGFIAYGVRALLVLRDAPWAARAYAWALFGTASTASLWANAVHAIRLNQPGIHTLTLGDNTVAVLSAIAPLALAGATHMYIIVGRHSGGHGSAAGTPVIATGAPAEIPATKPRAEARVAAGTGPAAPEGAPVPAAGERRRRKANGTSGRNPKAGKGGRKAEASIDQLADIIRRAHSDSGQVTRAMAREAIEAHGVSAGNDRIAEALKSLQDAEAARPHPSTD
ncbi:DUF2637 domain-containing protein [Actinacidiphila bryophytorum]|uniref:DUF2637 domain-containing protein n=1 Tax=Actinacidiphila bryophytorum TaxID=1436133 RepID=A0A9W4H584_9ACTN|nr:DUF2637 domain-containing protein [Actinacidiphila bryophytorum]MBM9437260.1 DUF2637 domain-containing protein [Actinacidiphila bryophytorum]MBN6541780.1 DUF2637 domain-containing protein [Actinacidiphila bryophytorum]CAG7651308.1 conserved membrane hypothetical protein [Actinacidiphila bryophytorum]